MRARFFPVDRFRFAPSILGNRARMSNRAPRAGKPTPPTRDLRPSHGTNLQLAGAVVQVRAAGLQDPVFAARPVVPGVCYSAYPWSFTKPCCCVARLNGTMLL